MTRATGQTNKTHTVKLPSALEHVQWRQSTAVPGAAAGLDIQTRFVGNGAEIEIALSDHNGRSHGTFKDKLHGNRFTAGITVPIKASGALYADVKLPRHGLSMNSGALLLTPPIEITNAMWSRGTARRGDILTLSADVKGAPDGTEASIAVWERDADGLKHLVTRLPSMVDGGKVRVEWEFVFPDSVAQIPTSDESGSYHAPEFVFTVGVLGIQVESPALAFQDWIDVEALDVLGRPEAGLDVTAYLADGSSRSATLDDRGRARIDDVPPGPYRVVLRAEKAR